MKTLAEFKTLTDTEEFFDFFGIEYEKRVIHAKRFHIMRKFGEMIANIPDAENLSEEKTLDFYEFALTSVYKNFESGYNPSAAEVWNMFEKQSGCLACAMEVGCSTKEPTDTCKTEAGSVAAQSQNAGFSPSQSAAGFQP